MQTVLKMMVAGAVLLGMTMPSFAQDTSTSGAASSSKANLNASQGNQQATNATGGGADLTLVQDSVTPSKIDEHGSETIKANPGMAYEAGSMSYSQFNCANSQGAGGSTFWASFTFSGSKESIACNFRANAIMHAQIDNNPASTPATHADAYAADWIVCTQTRGHRGRDIEAMCMQEGLIVNKDTPQTTSADTWHACHMNKQIFDVCQSNGLVSGRDTLDMKQP